ncbi:hypothetical protein GBF38_009116 [Nibea albiflora]|uniref:Uncharacterized protein n=1 Tax=Nibea albiflora TaxID=240163 RepID=A0ACB7ER82_NIBAL|nr:hypothetical protein GBF38_009116 [Nibea albiflora]
MWPCATQWSHSSESHKPDCKSSPECVSSSLLVIYEEPRKPERGAKHSRGPFDHRGGLSMAQIVLVISQHGRFSIGSVYGRNVLKCKKGHKAPAVVIECQALSERIKKGYLVAESETLYTSRFIHTDVLMSPPAPPGALLL